MLQMPEDLILQVTDLKKHFPIEEGFLRKRMVGVVKAVDGVSFQIKKGETLGLVGESGCGKTTTARAILRALEPTGGEVLFRTRSGVVDMAALEQAELKQARTDMQMIFQDPYASLNPRMPVADIIAEPLKAHGWNKQDRDDRVRELLEMVGLRPEYMRRFPHSFSGGQRQRIGVARALALNPALIVADEPVSALDVSVQAQVLNLLLDLQEQLGLAYLFIGHDLSVVRYLCDSVAVMYLGKIVEMAAVDTVYENPRHPYTSALLSAVPDADPHLEWRRSTVRGEVTGSETESPGCSFVSRCPYAADICRAKSPALTAVSGTDDSHLAACHFADQLELAGVG